ncbi:hypothetical protein KVT40_004242 [Elsinoe batatas]|uniref:Uncharacterized protein n=1 Tax=Elsinoe batatas TaxID=2601811 RepID=A0A8K0L2B0_9PEZI|nr:hypothetical protein KVT40_004242 [Elsinoe batatas]
MSLVSAQTTCYYPDKTIASTDIPCSSNGQATHCCPSDSFCMSHGLCAGGGVLSRASCTDQTWGAEQCARVCRDTNPASRLSLTPCGGRSFACGLNTTSCQTGQGIVTFDRPSALVLRPNQVAALLAAQGINTTTPSPSSTQTASEEPLYVDGQRMYPSSTVLALGLGMGFPLAFLVIAVIVMYRKLNPRAPSDRYDPPDQPPVPMVARSVSSRPSTSSNGRSPTIHTMHSSHTLHEPATMPRSFLDRYAQKAKEDPEVHEIDMGNPRYELGPNHIGRSPSRAELNGSQPVDTWKKVSKEPIGY